MTRKAAALPPRGGRSFDAVVVAVRLGVTTACRSLLWRTICLSSSRRLT